MPGSFFHFFFRTVTLFPLSSLISQSKVSHYVTALNCEITKVINSRVVSSIVVSPVEVVQVVQVVQVEFAVSVVGVK